MEKEIDKYNEQFIKEYKNDPSINVIRQDTPDLPIPFREILQSIVSIVNIQVILANIEKVKNMLYKYQQNFCLDFNRVILHCYKIKKLE
ncbi:hypothetical protein [Dubosiella newyorkensis]|uniref:hypothetical protein n=1 Tax=Dubosiella newyorkensis TaxID=1862672 RepID=UPI0032B21348